VPACPACVERAVGGQASLSTTLISTFIAWRPGTCHRFGSGRHSMISTESPGKIVKCG
jgi:hypothetical protein